jgi:hypothetical protein
MTAVFTWSPAEDGCLDKRVEVHSPVPSVGNWNSRKRSELVRFRASIQLPSIRDMTASAALTIRFVMAQNRSETIEFHRGSSLSSQSVL